MSLLKQALDLYRQKGYKSLIQKSIAEAYTKIYYMTVVLRGQYTLTLDTRTIVFSAPTTTVVRRNRDRFESESPVLSDFIDDICTDDVVYDVGANTGLYTLFAAKSCPDGIVLAFEPYPPNIELLKKDINRNQLQNIEIVDFALSNSIGNIEFSQPPEDDVGYGSSSIEADESRATTEIPTTTGDRLIAGNDVPEPTVIKIDVEGAESLVLDGLSQALSNPDCRTVYCEVHLPTGDHRPSVEDFGSSPEAICNRLEQVGFTVERLHRRDSEILYCGRK